jgi:hypothetical protein
MYLRGPLLILFILTQSRVTIFSGAVAVAAVRPRQAIVVILAGLLLAASFPAVVGVFDKSRFATTTSIASMTKIISSQWQSAPAVENKREYMIAAGFTGDGDISSRSIHSELGDMSFQIRIQKWFVIIKSALASPKILVFGMGAGAFGTAVDGNYVRILGESGLIGLTIYMMMLLFMLKRFNRQTLTFISLVSITITAAFIDILYSSKVMPLLWFVASWEMVRRSSLSALARTVEPSRRPLRPEERPRLAQRQSRRR